MRAFIADNLFLTAFVLSFLCITAFRFLRWIKSPIPRTDFFNFKSVAVSGGISVFLSIILIGIYLIFIIRDVDNKIANTYIELESAKPRIVIADTAIYENIGNPNYIGEKISIIDFKITDTVFPVASFQKGSLISGTGYILVRYKEKQFWISEKSSLAYFDYAYDNQYLEFGAQDENESALFWKRAQEYTEMYKESHRKDDLSETISNDTLIHTSYFNYNGSEYLIINRKKVNGQFLISISAAEYKGHEYSIIKGLKEKSNSKTCAYYIQHGDFYMEK